MQVLNSPQKFERPPFWNGSIYSIKIMASVTFNAMTCQLNFINIYQLVQKLMGEETRHTDRMVIALAYILLQEGK
jgi:hypothetical protein